MFNLSPQDIIGIQEAYQSVYLQEDIEQLDELIGAAIGAGLGYLGAKAGQGFVQGLRGGGDKSKPTPSKFAGYRDAAVARARQIQGSPVVGSRPAPAARPSGGSSAPAARPAASAPTAKPSPTPSAAPAKPTPGPSTPAAKPSAMDQWAKANPKLAAAKAERDRTRGTSSTTNPLMKDFKDKLPAPKSPSPTTTSTSFAKPTPALGSSSSAVQSGGSAAASRPSTNQTATAFSSPSLARSTPSTPAVKPTPMKKPMGSVKPGSLVSGFDMFDVVKGYLIDEGYAETEESAIAIMANMSEGWKLEIIDEAVKGEPSDRRRALAAERRKGIKPLSAKEGEKYATYKIGQMAYTKRAKMGDDD